jgi:hypothetical protein
MRIFFRGKAIRQATKTEEKHYLQAEKIKGFQCRIQLKNELTNTGVSVEYRPLRWRDSAALFNNLAK